MEEYDRMLRVNEVLKRELSSLCERYVSPDLEALLTITAVHTSTDLHHAKVFVSIMGNEGQAEIALRLCREHRGYFQKQIAKNVRLKYTPVLNFELDETPRKADEVLTLLDEIEEEENLGEDQGSSDPEENQSAEQT